MAIERQNIFDLIGKHQSRYQHCVITTFTFDPLFFEERAMRALRAANVRNVNILVDSGNLEGVTSHLVNMERVFKSSYSVIPIESKGVFHPKIMLLVGKRQALLAIGSGNLTSSGINTNDEVWGVVNIDGPSSSNAGIMAEVWKYLNPFFNQAKGIHFTKLSWIQQHCTWINSLSESKSSEIKANKITSLKFIANDYAGTHIQKIMEIVPRNKVKKLTVISPYFDAKGAVLEALLEIYNPEEAYCVTDRTHGLLPTELKEEVGNRIVFNDWPDAIESKDKTRPQLHAKIFSFLCADGNEYLIIGSANATIAGFGIPGSKVVNDEAGIIITRQQGNSSYLKDLGISPKVEYSFNVRMESRNQQVQGDQTQRSSHRLKIVSAEKSSGKIGLYLSKEPDKAQEVDLYLFGLAHEVRTHLSAVIDQDRISVEVRDVEPVLFVALYWEGQQVSNLVAVADNTRLLRTNPDETRAHLNDLSDQLRSNPETECYADLLKYADFDWMSNIYGAKNSSRVITGMKKPEQHHEQITEEKFNELSSVQLREAEILNNTSLVISEVLNAVAKGLDTEEQVKESIEQTLSIEQQSGQDGQAEEPTESYRFSDQGEQEKNAINRFLRKVEEWFTHKTEPFKKSGLRADAPNKFIEFKEVFNLSAALSLILIIRDKKYHKQWVKVPLKVNAGRRANLKSKEKAMSEADILMDLGRAFGIKPLEGEVPGNFEASYYSIDPKNLTKLKEYISEYHYDVSIDDSKKEVYAQIMDYLPEGLLMQHETEHGAKPYLIHLLGNFLLCANSKAGFRVYEDSDSLNARVEAERREIAYKGLFLLFNTPWKQSEKLYRDLMILDLIHSVYPSDDFEGIQEMVYRYAPQAYRIIPSFEEQLNDFESRLLPKYCAWLKIYSSDSNKGIIKQTDELMSGSIVFHKAIGFSSVSGVNGKELRIKKAGFAFDEVTRAYELKIRDQGLKIIAFN